MKEITKEQEERLLLYATYTILYMNDMACFSIQQLSKDVMKKDKESKKIYGALTKRTKTYLDKISRIVDNKMDYYCDFCTEMDNLCDDAYVLFKESLNKAYKDANIVGYEYMAKVETMRSMVELSVEAGKKVITSVSTVTPKAKWLGNYLFVEMMRIANNFAKWAYRKVPQETSINFNEESDVMQKFKKLSECLIDFYSFDKAYRNAIELEYERNNEKK